MAHSGTAGLRIGVITVPGDPVGQTSPLSGMRSEGLDGALVARGCELVSHELGVDAAAGDAGQAAAAAGKQLAYRWRATATLPHVILCDGFLAAMAAFAVAGRSGARVVLWLGTDVLPRATDQFRLAVAVTRSAAAVLTSSGELALRMRRTRISDQVDVVPPAVDLATVAEGLPWRLRHEQLDPADRGLVVSVTTGEGTVAADRRQVVDLVHRALPDARTVGSEDAAQAVDIAVTGMVPDGGRATLHAMARGEVVVSMPRQPDRDLVVHRASGLHVENSRGLFSALRELECDVFLREALAQGAVDKVRAQHATDVVAELLHHRLGALVAPGPAPAGPLTLPPGSAGEGVDDGRTPRPERGMSLPGAG